MDLGHLACCFWSLLSSGGAAERDDVCPDSNDTDSETMTASSTDVKLLRLTINMWWWVIIYFPPVKPHQHLSVFLLLSPLFLPAFSHIVEHNWHHSLTVWMKRAAVTISIWQTPIVYEISDCDDTASWLVLADVLDWMSRLSLIQPDRSLLEYKYCSQYCHLEADV